MMRLFKKLTSIFMFNAILFVASPMVFAINKEHRFQTQDGCVLLKNKVSLARINSRSPTGENV